MHPVEKRHFSIHQFSPGKVLLEIAMIVFSILLALGLESWNAGRHERRLANEALANIRTEMIENRAAVQAAIPRQEKLLENLNAVLGRQDGKAAGVTFSTGLIPPRLFKTAWETAAATQVLVKSDYGLVLAIAQPYDIQRWMSLIEEKWLQAILNPAAFDQSNRLRFMEIMRSLLVEFLAMEKRLLPELDGAIERLGNR